MAHSDPDLYSLLGVTPAVTSADITLAFRARLHALHEANDDTQIRHLLTAYIHLRRRHHQIEG